LSAPALLAQAAHAGNAMVMDMTAAALILDMRLHSQVITLQGRALR